MSASNPRQPSGPRLPPPLPRTPTSTDKDRSRLYWIGLLVALIAILLLFVLSRSAERPLSGTTPGPGENSVDELSNVGGADAKSTKSGGSSPETKSGRSKEEQLEPTSLAPQESQVKSERIASSHAPGDGDSDADGLLKTVNADAETTSASGSTSVAHTGQSESPGRVRRLNIGDGSMLLAVGEGNPLRVGSDVGSVVYVIDKSGSMHGQPFDQVSRSLHDAIDALDENQKFAVIMFDSQMQPLIRLRLEKATLTQKDVANNALRQVVADGGTQPFESVKNALDLRPDAIIVLSDGEFSMAVTHQITQYNQSNAAPTTIHCIGLHGNIATLRQLARDNGMGSYTTANLLQGP